MRPEQMVVVRWLRAQLDRMGLKPEQWARQAGIAPSTLTRGMKENYESVTSVPTLHALAVAAGVPSILDYLNDEAGRIVAPETRQIQTIVQAVLERGHGASIERTASAIAYGVALLMRTPETLRDEGAVQVAAHAAADSLSS